jgi:hypothetical protein
MFPRGLITAVLALQVLADRGQAFSFLPAMAFTVVLFTNIFVVVAAIRTKELPVSAEPSDSAALPRPAGDATPVVEPEALG